MKLNWYYTEMIMERIVVETMRSNLDRQNIGVKSDFHICG